MSEEMNEMKPNNCKNIQVKFERSIRYTILLLFVSFFFLSRLLGIALGSLAAGAIVSACLLGIAPALVLFFFGGGGGIHTHENTLLVVRVGLLV
jgi:hypothetical protein